MTTATKKKRIVKEKWTAQSNGLEKFLQNLKRILASADDVRKQVTHRPSLSPAGGPGLWGCVSLPCCSTSVCGSLCSSVFLSLFLTWPAWRVLSRLKLCPLFGLRVPLFCLFQVTGENFNGCNWGDWLHLGSLQECTVAFERDYWHASTVYSLVNWLHAHWLAVNLLVLRFGWLAAVGQKKSSQQGLSHLSLPKLWRLSTSKLQCKLIENLVRRNWILIKNCLLLPILSCYLHYRCPFLSYLYDLASN